MMQKWAVYEVKTGSLPLKKHNFMHQKSSTFNHYHHIGIYAYKAKTILKFASLPQSESEKAESLEQLRILEEGMSIAVAEVLDPPETGIDTREDLERINALFEKGLINEWDCVWKWAFICYTT